MTDGQRVTVNELNEETDVAAVDVKRIHRIQWLAVPVFTILGLLASIFLVLLAALIILPLLLAVLLFSIRVRNLPSRAVAFLWRAVSKSFKLSGMWPVLAGFTANELVAALRDHHSNLGRPRSPRGGDIALGYTVGGYLFDSMLRRFTVSDRVVEQGLMIAGERASDIAALIVPKLKKALVLSRGFMPRPNEKTVKYITIGRAHTFNPFECEGNIKRWAEHLSTAIAVSATLDADDANMLSNFFIYSKSVMPTSFNTLDWIDETDQFTGIYRSHPIKAALRNLLLGLDVVSGTGDTTLSSIASDLDRVDHVYLNLKHVDDKVYAFIASYVLLAAHGLPNNTVLVIHEFNLLAPQIELLSYDARRLWERIVNAAKKRRGIIAVSQSPLISPLLHAVIPNVIVTTGQDNQSIRALSSVFGLRRDGETILSSLHPQEALAKLLDRRGSTVTVFAFDQPQIPPVEEKEEGEAPPATEQVLRTSLHKDFNAQAEKAREILLFLQFMGGADRATLSKEFPASADLVSQLVRLAYAFQRGDQVLLTPKGKYALAQWEETVKPHRREVEAVLPKTVQPSIDAYAHPHPQWSMELEELLRRAENKLAIGNLKASVTATYMLTHRALKALAGLERGSPEEVMRALHLKGYGIDRSEVAKVKGIFLAARKGRVVTEEDARYSLQVAKKIATYFKVASSEPTQPPMDDQDGE